METLEICILASAGISLLMFVAFLLMMRRIDKIFTIASAKIDGWAGAQRKIGIGERFLFWISNLTEQLYINHTSRKEDDWQRANNMFKALNKSSNRNSSAVATTGFLRVVDDSNNVSFENTSPLYSASSVSLSKEWGTEKIKGPENEIEHPIIPEIKVNVPMPADVKPPLNEPVTKENEEKLEIATSKNIKKDKKSKVMEVPV